MWRDAYMRLCRGYSEFQRQIVFRGPFRFAWTCFGLGPLPKPILTISCLTFFYILYFPRPPFVFPPYLLLLLILFSFPWEVLPKSPSATFRLIFTTSVQHIVTQAGPKSHLLPFSIRTITHWVPVSITQSSVIANQYPSSRV